MEELAPVLTVLPFRSFFTIVFLNQQLPGVAAS